MQYRQVKIIMTEQKHYLEELVRFLLDKEVVINMGLEKILGKVKAQKKFEIDNLILMRNCEFTKNQ